MSGIRVKRIFLVYFFERYSLISAVNFGDGALQGQNFRCSICHFILTSSVGFLGIIFFLCHWALIAMILGYILMQAI